DIGVALRDISARYRLRPDEEAVEISALEMSAFGGAITTDPFRLDASGDDTTVLVHARSVNLAEMLSIQEFEAVDVTGQVDADLPVTLGEHGVRIADGRLSGLPPGGVIRYRQGAPAAESDTSAVGFATRALSNFEYETLSSDVSYAENGDLVLKMQIRGRNPDFEDGRPIVLNIGVENNVRDMLRSLQATRSAQEVIERRVNR
ncbi:MAG: YdbH domain-containing protein, partial [Woeseiaceae bacterium]